MRVVFCGGGTGGHVYPALTVAATLRRSHPDAELLYIGVRGKLDADLVGREGIRFKAVTAGPLRVGNPLGALKGGFQLAAGSAQAYTILREFQPDVVFATGGYGSAGVGLAARLRGLPLLVFLPDVAAGFAVRALTRLAGRVAVTVPPALEAVPADKAVLTGYPVREAFFAAGREDARRQLGLDPSLPTLLVMGGSTGASSINQAVAGWAADFLRTRQLFHISGSLDEGWLREMRGRLAPDLQTRYHLRAYVHEDIALVLAAADLAIMRSGASTLGELPAARLPAVLVPGGFSDQRDNALYLESLGAAVMLEQDRLAELEHVIEGLVADEDRRHRMEAALAGLARPDASDNLVSLITEMAGSRARVAA